MARVAAGQGQGGGAHLRVIAPPHIGVGLEAVGGALKDGRGGATHLQNIRPRVPRDLRAEATRGGAADAGHRGRNHQRRRETRVRQGVPEVVDPPHALVALGPDTGLKSVVEVGEQTVDVDVPRAQRRLNIDRVPFIGAQASAARERGARIEVDRDAGRVVRLRPGIV